MILEELIKKNKVPTLFIGSGISKRYLNNYPTWYELLKKIAFKIGIDDFMLGTLENTIKEEDACLTRNQIYSKIADKLNEKLNNMILSNDKKINEIFSDNDMKKLENCSTNRFKYLIAKEFNNYKIKEEFSYEIELLKKMSSKVGSVITTNYDNFLENEIFKNFSLKYSQEQLYFVNSYEYEAIYKIHGTIDYPDTIVINTNDYKNINENQRLFVAKIYELLMTSPMIFLGYSMCDDDILNILSKFTECFDSKTLSIISKNIIMVKYKCGENELIESQKIIKTNGTDIQITIIETDNFAKIYEYILKFELYLSPAEANKYRKLLYKLIRDNENGSKKIMTIGELNINELDPNKVIIALGNYDTINEIEEYGVIGMQLTDIVKCALLRTNLNCKLIIEKWCKKNLQIKYTLPSFYLAKNYDGDINEFVEFKNNYEYLYNKFSKKVENIKKESKKVSSETVIKYSLKSKLENEDRKNLYLACINNEISKDELRKVLIDIYNNNNAIINQTYFKELVCFIDFDINNCKSGD